VSKAPPIVDRQINASPSAATSHRCYAASAETIFILNRPATRTRWLGVAWALLGLLFWGGTALMR